MLAISSVLVFVTTFLAAGLAVLSAVMLERTGESAAICSECVELCNEIILEEFGI